MNAATNRDREILDAVKKLEDKVASNCAKVGVPPADVACDAVAYIVSKYGYDIEQDEFMRLAMMKATCIIRDALRAQAYDHGKRSIRTSSSLDCTVEGEDGTAYCPLDAEASVVAWGNHLEDIERDYRRELARKVLDKVCDNRKIGKINLCVYKAVVLRELPRKEVAERFGMTRNAVDQIVHRIEKCLKEDGRRIYDELYGLAA